MPVPNKCRDLGILVAEYHTHCHRAFDLRASTILRVLEATDAFRREGRFEQFLLACEADARGRKGLETRDYAQADLFRGAFAAARAVDAAAIAAENSPEDIAEAILFILSRPAHVNINEIHLLPADQAAATMVNRKT